MEFLDTIILQLSGYELRLEQLLMAILSIILAYALYRWIRILLKPRFEKWETISKKEKNKLLRTLGIFIVFIVFIVLTYSLELNYNFTPGSQRPINLALIFEALAIIQFARMLDWIVSNYLIHRSFARRDQDKGALEFEVVGIEKRATRTVQYLVYVFALILIINDFGLDRNILQFDINETNRFSLSISKILGSISIILIARLVVWAFTQLFLYGYYKQKNIEVGARFAINQLVAYVIYFISVLFVFQALGINMTLIWGGAAALLVGLGLGLQQTFNDFFSGIVLLFERSVKVGDVVQMESTVGIIRKIGMRASIVESRDSVSIIVPNSKLVNQNVVNWTHSSQNVRFRVEVNVAYGSDTNLVKLLLLEAANKNERILQFPAPFVRFKNFADSSLFFEVFFFSDSLIVEEDIKSDLRFQIDQLFRENNVKIPFPQRDVHLFKEP